MSKQYRVHVYAVCHAKLSTPVDATTHQRAAQKILDALDSPYHESPLSLSSIFENRSDSDYVEHDENGDIGFLVDRVGDEQFEESCWFHTEGGKAKPLADPMQMFSVSPQQENEKLRTLLHDVLHQISTDSDLETVTGAAKYEALAERIRAVLPIDKQGII